MGKKILLIRRVVGLSMEPAFVPGQIIIASALRRPRLNDVVILRHDGLEKVKRVAKLDDGKIFVTGDNPVASTDSRHFGMLPESAIIAAVIWPRRISRGHAAGMPARKVRRRPG